MNFKTLDELLADSERLADYITLVALLRDNIQLRRRELLDAVVATDKVPDWFTWQHVDDVRLEIIMEGESLGLFVKETT